MKSKTKKPSGKKVTAKQLTLIEVKNSKGKSIAQSPISPQRVSPQGNKVHAIWCTQEEADDLRAMLKVWRSKSPAVKATHLKEIKARKAK